jgi:hypothetical protein
LTSDFWGIYEVGFPEVFNMKAPGEFRFFLWSPFITIFEKILIGNLYLPCLNVEGSDYRRDFLAHLTKRSLYMNGSKRSLVIGPLSIVIFILILWSMAGCTFKNVKAELATAPGEKYSVFCVGDISVDDKLWDPLIPHFRRGLVKELTEQKVFEAIHDPAPANLPESSLVLSGKIIEVTKGSAALRWLVGFGAGKAKVKGRFEIANFKGTPLAKFEADEAYAGGAGIGGAGFLDMEDLMRRFGETIGKKTVQWSRGEKIDE